MQIYLRANHLFNAFRYNISESESMEQLLYRLIGNIFHCQFNDTESLFYDGNIQHYTSKYLLLHKGNKSHMSRVMRKPDF